VPPTITHRIAATFTPARDDQVPLAAAYPDRLSQDGGTVHIAQREPIVIGPPIQGDDWVAFNACCTVSQHRGSLLPSPVASTPPSATPSTGSAST
jgi:hypothetical protein